MDYKRCGNQIVLRLDKGDELLASIKELADKESISSASIVGIGASDKFSLYDFDEDKPDVDERNFNELHDISNFTGNISVLDGENFVHMHMTCVDKFGNVSAGHVLNCIISHTAEIFITVFDFTINRCYDDEFGIDVFDF